MPLLDLLHLLLLHLPLVGSCVWLISMMVTSSNFSAMISEVISTRSRASRTISCCLSRIRVEPYWVLSCCAPSVSFGSVAPRMMSDRPMIW